MQIELDSIERLTKDIKTASLSLSRHEARFLTDAYYSMQTDRIRANNQVRALNESDEPNLVLQYLAQQRQTLEAQVKRALDAYSASHPAGIWARSITGIGPVIAAGLLAHIDVQRAQTAGQVWRYSGLDPTSVWGKGEKRPWNAKLKRLCCLPGTVVTTRNGPKMIEEVQTGDEVLTHKGRWRPVTEVMPSDYDGDMATLRAHGLAGNLPTLTVNHPVLTKQRYVDTWRDADGRERFRGRPHKLRSTQLDDAAWDEMKQRIDAGERSRDIAKDVGCSKALVCKVKHGYERSLPVADPIEWSRADSITPGWCILTPTPPIGNQEFEMVLEDLPCLHNPASNRVATVDNEIARLVGLFLGDGYTSNNRVVWYFGRHEANLSSFVIDVLQRRFGIQARERVTHNMRIVICGSQQLQRWFDQNTGKLAHHKHLPAGWIDATKEVITGLLRGLFESDGHTPDDAVSFVSVNWHLANSTVQMLRSLRLVATAVPQKHSYSYRIQVPDEVAFHDIVMNCYVDPKPTNAVSEWADEGSWHTARDAIIDHYTGKVYNLEVAEDHSYVAGGVAVHNCWLIGESFVKVSGRESDIYGKIWRVRKDMEIARNEAGQFADQAKAALEAKNFGADTNARKAYEQGKLPDARIHLRAERYAVKLFLSHFHHVLFESEFGRPPPKPYIFSRPEHTHFMAPPNWPLILSEKCKITEYTE